MRKKILKDEIIEYIDNNKNIYEKISLNIFNNPELGLEEKYASDLLTKTLEENGFIVERNIADLETAFIGTFSSGAGPVISFLCEYDALPKMGHACGHNIIGTTSLGAGIALKNIMIKHKLKGTIKVIGCPGEEQYGCKINLIEAGIFKNIDYALMLHPADASMYDDISFACSHIEYKFKGKSAHSAAAPWKGKSALSGVIELFNSSNSLRLHLKDNTRLHGIITEGGTVDNIIPEEATAIFNIRALTEEYLNEMILLMENCAKGAAMMTGTTVEIKVLGKLYKEVNNDKKLSKIVKNNFEYLNEPYIERTLEQGIGSTDMGNVTHELPAIHAYINLKNNSITHTEEFANYAGGEEGKIALIKGIKVLALSGLDLL